MHVVSARSAAAGGRDESGTMWTGRRGGSARGHKAKRNRLSAPRTVSRSTQVEDVCKARELLMMPKDDASGASSARSSRASLMNLGGDME